MAIEAELINRIPPKDTDRYTWWLKKPACWGIRHIDVAFLLMAIDAKPINHIPPKNTDG